MNAFLVATTEHCRSHAISYEHCLFASHQSVAIYGHTFRSILLVYGVYYYYYGVYYL